MWPYAEFLGGLGTFAIGLLAIGLGIRLGRKAAWVLLAVASIVEALVLAGLFLDWGYDWFDRTALDIALNSNVWVALPHALALMVLTILALWGTQAAPWTVLLAALQSASFPPVIFLVELDTDFSFLSPAPLASMYLSLLAAFFLLPTAWRYIPPEGSRWHRVAFAPRADLIEAIRSLTDLGFSVSPPETILESGSARGLLGNVQVFVTTRPSLFPPAYAFRVRWTWPSSPPPIPVSRPLFAHVERLSVTERSCHYEGLSTASFSIFPGSLQQFLVVVAQPRPP